MDDAKTTEKDEDEEDAVFRKRQAEPIWQTVSMRA
jgi:hypothetical protein